MKRARRANGTRRLQFEDVKWLNEVQEVRHSLDLDRPISIREDHVTSGGSSEPTVPFPERHPFCELNILLEGEVRQFIGDENIGRRAVDVMLLGPGMPHYAFRHSYPHHTLTVYFLPLTLFELGPAGDAARVLSRFSSGHPIEQRIVQLPQKSKVRLVSQISEMKAEFESGRPGSQLRLWSMLLDSLVGLMRSESTPERWYPEASCSWEWPPLEKALRYIHHHYSEVLYVEQIAAAGGLPANRFRKLFRKMVGMNCTHYLHSLRITQAKARLCLPNAQVTEVALSVGFETLSHFNMSFRKATGMSPTEFIRTVCH